MTESELYTLAMETLPDKYDKSRGTVLSDIIAATAKLTDCTLRKTDTLLDNMIYDTADEDWKEKIARDRCNLERKQATYASGNCQVKGEPGAGIEIGDKVATDTIVFTVIKGTTLDAGGAGEITVRCDIEGAIGNVPAGAINSFPVTLSGIFEVTNPVAFENGYEKESIKDFDTRYYAKRNNPGTSGNKHHYKNWAMEIAGVGDCKVFPRVPSRGYVTVVIIDSERTPASEELIRVCQNYIDEMKPTSADAVVKSASGLKINISVSLVTEGIKDYTVEVKEVVRKYLADIAFKQDYVSYARVGEKILSIEGIKDYSNLRINGESENISVPDMSVAILGGVSVV